jgi:hypothetical protein
MVAREKLMVARRKTVADQPANGGDADRRAEIGVDSRVRVYPGTDRESRGVVVEDFGEMTAQAVDIGDNHFADPARRWAVVLDAGTLVFLDSDQLLPE